MTPPRAYRSLALAIAINVAAASAVVLTQDAAAQAFPSKPIRIISPFAPGGGNDIICRSISPKMSEGLKQQVIVDNRPGANGIIGTDLVAKAAPDGYTIVLIPSGHAVNHSLYKKLPFDSVKDFTPISLAGSSPLVLAVHPSLPVKNVKDLIALARARPGQLTYVSAGIGASGHLAGALFDTMTGTKMIHIPYKGMSLALSDLMGGQVSMTFGTSLSVVPQVKSGRLRALAVTGGQRSPSLPDMPTIAESGVPGYEAGLWYGFIGPARMPADIVKRLNAEIVAAIGLPDVAERLASQGLDAKSSTPEELGRMLTADLERWAKVIKQIGIQPE